MKGQPYPSKKKKQKKKQKEKRCSGYDKKLHLSFWSEYWSSEEQEVTLSLPLLPDPL